VETKQIKLYMPLHGDLYERNKWGDLEETPYEMNGRELAAHEDAILAALVRARMPEEAERGLMHWYQKGDAVDEKVRSAVFSLEEHGGTLYGTVECMVTDDLTPDEMASFKEYITGQSSDGWGEGFEQREIHLPDKAELYVHLWDSSDHWSLMTEAEFEAAHGQEYGGMQFGH
jgi:hypothetical protein